ncbi:MAG: GNAT family N-acetyltransferase [Caulobacter sp.]|nr:GNAT family N-acetyltransferase [Caulobacter sp.]
MTPAEIEQLERIADRAWPAVERASLGGWILNAASGFSGRLNACWPLGPAPGGMEAAIDAVEAWYGARNMTPIFKPAGPQPDLEAALAARGYRSRTPTLMMTAELAAAPASPRRVAVSDEADAAFEQVFLGSQADPLDAAERIGAFRRVSPLRLFARIDIDGAPAAIGGSAVEGEWAGVFGMRTLGAHRRQGLARDIVAALLAGAWQAGARRAYLQVEAPNAPAIALYEGFGFSPVFSYAYWDRAAA